MPLAEAYRKQVALLIKIVPLVAAEPAFALKGGTAINLFLRDMPRVSVDIDLTYVPIKNRASSLKDIDAAMKRISAAIEHGVRNAKVNASSPKGEKGITKLIVRGDGVQIKIEVTPVLRGCVYEPEVRSVSARVEEEFGFAEISGRQFRRPVRRQDCSCARSPASARFVRCAGFVRQGRYRRRGA